MLPKFLIADNSIDRPGRLYVVHTQSPQFILEGSDEDFLKEQKVYWMDEVPDEEEGTKLMYLANDFLDRELENQEDIYDDDLE